jgi:hypothetical protein
MRKQLNVNRILNPVFVTLFLLMSSGVSATHIIEKQIQLQKRADKQFLISVSGTEAADLHIRLWDTHQVRLYKVDMTGVRDYRKVYDMSRLPAGEYFLEIENESRIAEWTIRVEERDLHIVQTGEISIPRYSRTDRRIALNLADPLPHPARIRVVDQEGTELYEEEVTVMQPMKKIFDFSAVPRGNYQIVTRIGDRKFRYYVSE